MAGDKIQLSLPVGTFNASMLNSVDQLILLAAGTGQLTWISNKSLNETVFVGFTPMVKVIRKICTRNREYRAKKTTVKLLFFNRALKDILWWDKLQSLSEEDPK